MTQDFRNLISGKFGKLPTDANPELVKKALEQNKMDKVMTCRPADEIAPEWDKMVEESKKNGGNGSDEDVLTYAMFPNVAPKFFAERAKGPVDAASTFAKKPEAPAKASNGGSYTINVNGTAYNVTSDGKGNINVNGNAYNVSVGAAGASPAPAAAPAPAPKAAAPAPAASAAPVVTGGADINSPVAGTLLRYAVDAGSTVKTGDTVIVLESMKMELEVKAPCDGVVNFTVTAGSQVASGQKLGSIGGKVAAPAPAPTAPAAPAPAAAPAAASAPAASGAGKPVPSPVAGTLLRYAVDEGSAVNAGDTVIVLESMKMELEVKAPSAGKVHFAAATGSQVSNGQVIAEIQ